MFEPIFCQTFLKPSEQFRIQGLECRSGVYRKPLRTAHRVVDPQHQSADEACWSAALGNVRVCGSFSGNIRNALDIEVDIIEKEPGMG